MTTTARRPGDIAAYWADPSLAHRVLGWQAKRGIDAMCADAWRWQTMNPNGYTQELPAAIPSTEAED